MKWRSSTFATFLSHRLDPNAIERISNHHLALHSVVTSFRLVGLRKDDLNKLRGTGRLHPAGHCEEWNVTLDGEHLPPVLSEGKSRPKPDHEIFWTRRVQHTLKIGLL